MRLALVAVIAGVFVFLVLCFAAFVRVALEDQRARVRAERNRREMAEGWQAWSERVRAEMAESEERR